MVTHRTSTMNGKLVKTYVVMDCSEFIHHIRTTFNIQSIRDIFIIYLEAIYKKYGIYIYSSIENSVEYSIVRALYGNIVHTIVMDKIYDDIIINKHALELLRTIGGVASLRYEGNFIVLEME